MWQQCNDEKKFIKMNMLEDPFSVSLGDGHSLPAIGKSNVVISMKVPVGKTRKCTLIDVLFVPKLSINLICVSKATKTSKPAKFTDKCCNIFDYNEKLIAVGTKIGNLYYLLYDASGHVAHTSSLSVTKEDIWHQRYGHLGIQNLKILSSKILVEGFDFDTTKNLEFCKPCADGKNHLIPFQKD